MGTNKKIEPKRPESNTKADEGDKATKENDPRKAGRKTMYGRH